MSHVSLIDRARLRARARRSVGTPLAPSEATALQSILHSHGHSVGARGNLGLMAVFGARPSGGQVASIPVRQYMAGARSNMLPPGTAGFHLLDQLDHGAPSKAPNNAARAASVGALWAHRAMAIKGCTSHGQCGPLESCEDGECVNVISANRTANRNRYDLASWTPVATRRTTHPRKLSTRAKALARRRSTSVGGCCGG